MNPETHLSWELKWEQILQSHPDKYMKIHLFMTITIILKLTFEGLQEEPGMCSTVTTDFPHWRIEF